MLLPNLEENVTFADEVYTLLMELGIKLIDVKDQMIWGKKEEEMSMGQEPDVDADLEVEDMKEEAENLEGEDVFQMKIWLLLQLMRRLMVTIFLEGVDSEIDAAAEEAAGS